MELKSNFKVVLFRHVDYQNLTVEIYFGAHSWRWSAAKMVRFKLNGPRRPMARIVGMIWTHFWKRSRWPEAAWLSAN